MRAGSALLAAAGLAAFVSCSAGPPPRDIAEARLALQDAKNAGADQRAVREYDAAAAHLSVAQSTWNNQKDSVAAAHWARLAQAEARQAQYVAEAAAAQEMVLRETERRHRGELAVREAEIAMLQTRARTEAEKRAAEIEARAAEERRRSEEELARREAEARDRERLRSEGEARLQTERARAEQESAARTQAERDRIAAEIEKMKTDLEATRRAAEEAQKAAETERQRLEEQRRAAEARAAELAKAREGQQQAEDALKVTLSQLAQVREEARGLILTLPGSIYFEVNKSEVKPGMRDRLSEIANHRRRRVQPEALASPGRGRALDPDRGRSVPRPDREPGVRQDAPGRLQRHGGGQGAEPARRDRDPGRGRRPGPVGPFLADCRRNLESLPVPAGPLPSRRGRRL